MANTVPPVPYKQLVVNTNGYISEAWAKWFREVQAQVAGNVTQKVLIESKYASLAGATEYTSPASTSAIIDKFTATNTDSGSQTLTINLVPSGGTPGGSNTIISTQSIAAGATHDFTDIEGHYLATGDFIKVTASVASKIVIRSSGREIKT